MSDTYLTRKISAVYDEAKPAEIEVIASIGEFDGICVGVTTSTYELVEVTADGARELIAALTEALRILESN